MSVQPIFTPVRRRPRIAPGAYVVRAVSRPATAFTGDFFFTSEVDGALWFALGDIAGHGLKAAVFMSMLQEALEEAIHDCRSNDPAEVVATLDVILREVLPINRFATLVLGRAFADGRVDLVNAGHCPPLIVRDDSVTRVGSHGPVVGIVPVAAWQQERFTLERGERLLLYTDGVTEAEDANEQELGVEGLIDQLDLLHGPDPMDSVLDLAERHRGGPLSDDATVMMLMRR
jgi:serine phosphatase RsbU (regulator of sigma subunit)